MKTLRLFAITWLSGLLSVIPALAVKFKIWTDDTIARQRFQEILTTTEFAMLALVWLIGLCLVFALLYLPGLALLRGRLRGVLPAWPFPLLTVLLGLLACVVARIILPHHPKASAFPPDMIVVCWMLTVSGVAAGLGFVGIHRHAHNAS